MQPQNNFSRRLAKHPCSSALLPLFLLASWLASVTPLHAQSPPTFLFQWGGAGGGNGQFNDPMCIAVGGNNKVYVVDNANQRIQLFNSNGDYISQWGSFGSGNGQFSDPIGLATDSSNNVYVTDFNNERIEKFGPGGNYLTQWGSAGSGNGQFSGPQGIAIDSDNNVYVGDTANYRIEKFGSNGNYLTQWTSASTLSRAIAIDSSNNVYVTDALYGSIYKYDNNGNSLTQWVSSVANPGDIAIDRSNDVYVAGAGSDLVVKFDDNGNYLTQWGSPGTNNGQFEYPQGIALDGSGNFIYVADEDNNRVQVFANNTAQLPPYIAIQPANQTVPAGGKVTFAVMVVGAVPFAYQWTSNNVALPDATNSTLTLSKVMLSATYAVAVTNSFGGVLSGNAVLGVPPALVTTLPASGVYVAGATLNASVTVGETTAVWFDWGADTNYGNITATTIVPGGSGSSNISVTLNGLATNVYHYQIVATNISGIVYGNDESFSPADLAPTVTTLSPVNVTNGVILYASVNPNGLDTQVYFRWGPFGGLTNITPGMDVGASATPLNVSSFIAISTRFVPYSVEIVASNHLGTVVGSVVSFEPPFANLPSENWDSVASSADGRVLVAASNPGPSYISTNGGTLWMPAGNLPIGRVESVACSADGSKIIAGGGGGEGAYLAPIYTSSDAGVTWVSNNAPVRNWQAVASSADGTKLVAADYADKVIYTSTNAGAIWTQASNAPPVPWYDIALSADSSKLAAVAWANTPGSGSTTNIYTSTDFGETWATNSVPPAPHGVQYNWDSIASSADGNILVASGGANSTEGYVFISTNSGAFWMITATNMTPFFGYRPWQYVAISADGSKMAAVAAQPSPGDMILSTNTGATWFTNAVPVEDWNAVALSADGNKLVAAIGYPAVSPYIYIRQTTPAPILSLLQDDGNLAPSWLIPSLAFTLRQSPDLINWSDVTNVPVLNLKNLQDQVILPFKNDNHFFRLMH